MTLASPLWTPPELVAAARGAVAGRVPFPATGVSIDSRSLAPGDLFVALTGPDRDGHDYVAAALARGAAVALVSRLPEGLGDDAPLVLVDDTQAALERLGDAARRRSRGRIAAVTGSVGKTGSKEMLGLVLSEQAPSHWSSGSLNNRWGVPLSLARMPREAEYGVFEIGMNHPGEITPLAHLVRPEVALVTTVEPAHLEFFDGIEAIADAKAEIFQGMPGSGVAVLNRDNPMFDRLAAHARARGLNRIISFGLHEAAEMHLVAARLDPEGVTVSARLEGRPLDYRLNQPGSHLVMNSLGVLAAAAALGADLARAAASLARYQGVAGRGRRVEIRVAGGTAVMIDDSYNASPAAVRAALAVLGGSAGRRRVAVLGDMRELGTQGPDLHRGLAPAVLEARVDLVFACGELMRELYEALPEAQRGAWAESAAALQPLVAAALRQGDVVLVKGSLGSSMAEIVQPLQAGAAGSQAQ